MTLDPPKEKSSVCSNASDIGTGPTDRRKHTERCTYILLQGWLAHCTNEGFQHWHRSIIWVFCFVFWHPNCFVEHSSANGNQEAQKPLQTLPHISMRWHSNHLMAFSFNLEPNSERQCSLLQHDDLPTHNHLSVFLLTLRTYGETGSYWWLV